MGHSVQGDSPKCPVIVEVTAPCYHCRLFACLNTCGSSLPPLKCILICDCQGAMPSRTNTASHTAMPAWGHVTSCLSRVLPCQHGITGCHARMGPGVPWPARLGMSAMPAWVQPYPWSPGCGTGPHGHGLSTAPCAHGRTWAHDCTVCMLIPCPCGPMQPREDTVTARAAQVVPCGHGQARARHPL